MKITILFDLDGTLIDSTEAILESFAEAYKTLNTPPPNEEQIIKLIGYPLDVMFRDLGVVENLVWDFVAGYKVHYRRISKQKTTLLPNAKEAILKAHSFATLGIVTTKTARYSKELLEHLELMKYFEVLIGREDVENPKPHQEPILKALEKLNSKAQDSWMIGDTCLDIISAKNANVKSVAVRCGYGSEEQLKKCAKVIKNDSLEAVEFIKGL